MRKLWIACCALAVAALLMPALASAKGPQGKGQGQAKAQQKKANAGAKNSASEPKGWDEGKKTGWKGEEAPPGTEKKEGAAVKGKSATHRHRGQATAASKKAAHQSVSKAKMEKK